MQGNIHNNITGFWVAGINYKKTEAAIRGEFAINPEQYEKILSIAPGFGLSQLFILSTCNRTEIYGFAEDPQLLIQLLCTQTSGSKETFLELAYIKEGLGAIEHMFNVGGGLDSQILGDYEIVGQLKQSVMFAKKHGFIGSFIERLLNSVLQSSKMIKNQTALSGGTVSVSFAAVQYLKDRLNQTSDKKILLLGVGKIGRITCKNLVDYLDTRDITLINRTDEKAAELANEMGIHHAPFKNLEDEIRIADIIIVATNAVTPTILKSHLENTGQKIIIDLSVPYNVETSVNELCNISLIHVDELSKLKDETVQKRKAEIPKAKSIISTHVDEFLHWLEMRKHVPVLKAVKDKLEEIHSASISYNHFTPTLFPAVDSRENIQKVINVMALKMRSKNQRGCHYIEAINDFMAKL